MADITFGPFTLDPSSNRLLRDGVDVRMRPQAFQALRSLAAHGGRTVDYDKLIADAWGGTSVSRHTVDVTIAEVRKLLTDCGSWICRQPKGGYALLVPKSDTLVRLGWHFLSQRSRDGFDRALECFGAAATEAPRDHRAFEGQSAVYLLQAGFGMRDARQVEPLFWEAHTRAVDLVGLTPELRSNYGHALHMFKRRLDDAEAQFTQAIADKPGLATAYVRYALLLTTRGDLDAALATIGRARTADPLFPHTAPTEVAVRVWRREFDIAVALGAQAVQLHPYLLLARAFYGIALEFSGQLEEALEQFHIGSVTTQGLPWIRGLEGSCLVKLRREKEARAILKELLDRERREYIDSYALARLHMALGETDRAFAALERAIKESAGGLYSLKVDPVADPFRADKRFGRLLKQYLQPLP